MKKKYVICGDPDHCAHAYGIYCKQGDTSCTEVVGLQEVYFGITCGLCHNLNEWTEGGDCSADCATCYESDIVAIYDDNSPELFDKIDQSWDDRQ